MTEPTVADVMTRDVLAVAPDTALETVVDTLLKHRISGMPVVDARGRAIGIVSLPDLVDPERNSGDAKGFPVIYHIEDGWAAPSIEGADVRRGRVEDVMSPIALTIESGTSIVDAAAMMVERRIHRLLVTENDVLSGIVSTLDLLRGFVDTARK
jgi:CBS domain-containing protein